MQQISNPFQSSLPSNNPHNTSYYHDQTNLSPGSNTGKFALFFGILSILLLLFGGIFLFLRKPDLVEGTLNSTEKEIGAIEISPIDITNPK
jgi:hypothetical protein